MKPLFIFRDDFVSHYLLTKLLKAYPDATAILESGKKAKIQKLKRTFFKSNFLLWPIKILDLVALQVYSIADTHGIKRYLRPTKEVSLFTVEDINDKACVDKIRKIKPTIIIIFGTSIVRKPFFEKVHTPVFNIHTGILPLYRNVHSEFWAYKRGDYKNIGTSIIHLAPGVDTGAIALRRRVSYEKGDSLLILKVKNIDLIVPLVKKLLKLFENKKVPKEQQHEDEAGFYRTPTFFDLLSFLLAK